MDWILLMICEANYRVIAKLLRMLKERITLRRLHLRKCLLVQLKCIDQERTIERQKFMRVEMPATGLHGHNSML